MPPEEASIDPGGRYVQQGFNIRVLPAISNFKIGEEGFLTHFSEGVSIPVRAPTSPIGPSIPSSCNYRPRV